MKSLIKNKVTNIFDKILIRILKRVNYLENQSIENKKIQIISYFQSSGYGVKLNGNNWLFSSPNKIIIGNNVHIGNNAFFKTEGGLIIGDNTHISRNVTIYTINHDYKGNALPYDNKNIYKPVVIGKNVWIGMNVSIIPGITIGDGAIIGMGTVVNRNVKKNEIVGNTKIDTIKFRSNEHYEKLNSIKKFGGINGKPLVEKEIKLFKPTYQNNKNKEIVFILGSGRSGSKSIVDTLNQHPGIKAFHENIRHLIRISTNIAHDKENEDKYLNELNAIFNIKIWQATNDQLLIHSDQRLWNLVPFLSEYFPNSKFIHLIREPKATIKSMIARDWYQDNEYPDYNIHDWAKYRLQADKIGCFSTTAWQNLSNTQKCSWYWSYINKHIEDSLKSIPKDRVFSINLKDLQKNIKYLLKFLKVDDIPLSIQVTNKRNVIHANQYSKINSYEVDNMILTELKKYNFLFKDE